ncbi:hypothetical protein Tco_0070456 [Tanacetum coccineum]
MCSGDKEANVPSAFKKNVVPRKTRYVTIADNIVEVPVTIELVKSISIEEQRRQQRDIMTQLLIDQQIDKDVEDMYAELESIKQMKQAVTGEGSSAAHAKYYEFENTSATDSDATRGSSCSDTNEEKDDETSDFDDSDMELSDDSPQGDDDAIGFGVFMYNKSTEPLKSTYLTPTITCYSLDYI